MAEILASAALFGAVSGAVIGVTTGRAVNRGLDAVVDMATTTFRAWRNLQDYRAIYPELFLQLDELDVDARLRVVLSLLNSADSANAGEAVKIAVSEVREAIDAISKVLELIHVELRAHRERWFASFFSPRVGTLIDQLKVKMAVMDRRVELLVKSQVFLETIQNRSSLKTNNTPPPPPTSFVTNGNSQQ